MKDNEEEYPIEIKELFVKLRREGFSRLDDNGQVYLDYTGSALYPALLPQQHLSALQTTVFGNPHSAGSPSMRSASHLTAARQRVLNFFGADPAQYDVIFTPNASGGAKIVAECFPFTRGSAFLLTFDNHNSVVGMREFARSANATVKYIQIDQKNLRAIDPVARIDRYSKHARKRPSLLAFPAQSNFSGVKHSLSLCKHAKNKGFYVFLDAAAYAPSSPIDLSRIGAVDFMIVSFYKLFGYPTGIGALLIRKSALTLLRQNKPWFAGGTVRFVSNSANTHVLHHDNQAFEDGTVNFLSMRAVVNGVDFLERIGMENVKAHVQHLTRMLLTGLTDMQWSNGKSKIRVYGPTDNYMRGGAVAFDLILPNGQRSDARKIETAAGSKGISIRTDCFCNPGAGETALQLKEQFKNSKCLARLGEDADIESVSSCIGLDFLGCARASIGLCNNERDVESFLLFIAEYSEKVFVEYKNPQTCKLQSTENSLSEEQPLKIPVENRTVENAGNMELSDLTDCGSVESMEAGDGVDPRDIGYRSWKLKKLMNKCQLSKMTNN